jgi:hypothetical protein
MKLICKKRDARHLQFLLKCVRSYHITIYDNRNQTDSKIGLVIDKVRCF